jgi:hypothetical protein
MSDRFETAIRGAVNAELEKIAEEEIAAAKERVEKRIRGMVANIALTVSRQYEIRRLQDRIVIEVRDQR